MNDCGNFKRAFETKVNLIELTQGRASKVAGIKCTRLCQIHIGQLKTTVVDMCRVDSINYLMEVEVEQDFVTPENTPELPRPQKFSSLKIELLVLRAPLDSLPAVQPAIIRKYGNQAGCSTCDI